MAAAVLQVLLLLQVGKLLIAAGCDRRGKSRDYRMSEAPNYHIHPSDVLPSDVQISTFLQKGETKSFSYNSQIDHGALSATIITCSSPVRWSIEFFKSNSTTGPAFVTKDIQTHHLPLVLRGIYILQVLALEGSTFLHIYISTEEGGPQAMQNAHSQDLRLLKRQRRRRLTVKWTHSLVDPQGTDYCLVTSTQRHYQTLCAAQAETYGTAPVVTKTSTGDDGDTRPLRDPSIACVGRKTQFTLSDLRQGQIYYLDLFARNHQSNLTYAFGSTNVTFNGHVRPATLRDGKAAFANLKKLDGKAVFRFKVGGKAKAKAFDLFVVPCGGAVDVEVSLKDKVVQPPVRIEGFGKISIPNPVSMSRYYVKIFAMNREELKRTTGVEVIVYATTKSPSRIPLPNMPQEARVHEYTSMRTCDSVTVGWLVAPQNLQKLVHYCLVVKEGRMRDVEDYRMPNQCGLENRLRKSADFAFKYCIDIKNSKEQVVTQKIDQLKPGRSYIVQVTVKKPKGKTLSYDLLQVYTKPSCVQQ